jgi:hypothetical protein
MGCVSIDEIFALSRDRLPLEEAERVRAHLGTGCSSCGKQMDQIEKILVIVSSDGFSNPPAWLIEQAVNLFDWWHRINPLPGSRQQVPAFLVFDSFDEPASGWAHGGIRRPGAERISQGTVTSTQGVEHENHWGLDPISSSLSH